MSFQKTDKVETSKAVRKTDSASSIPPSQPPDFVLVWNKSEPNAVTETAIERRKIFEFNLEEEGLILTWGESEDSRNLQVVKIWAPLEVLKRYSEILKLRLPMKQTYKDETRNYEEFLIVDSDNTTASLPNTMMHNPPEQSKADLPVPARRCCTCCCGENGCYCCNFELDPTLFPMKYRRLTRVYSRDKEYLFDVNEDNKDEIFPLSTKARIVEYILERTPFKPGEELARDAFAVGYERLAQQDIYEAGYPLHDGTIHTDGSTRNLLHEHWGKFSNIMKFQPLDTLRDYLGVSTALYFAWLGYYTKMLIFAAILGLFSFLYGIATFSTDTYVKDVCDKSLKITMCPACDKYCAYWKLSEKCSYSKIAHLFDNDLTVVYSLLMSIWAAFFLEFWKRYCAILTHHWDLSDFDMKDLNIRPEYVAELKKRYPSGSSKTEKVPKNKRRTTLSIVEVGVTDAEEEARFEYDLTLPYWQRTVPYTMASYSAVLFLVALAFTAISGVIIFRLWFTIWLSKDNYKDKKGFAWEGLAVSFTAAVINLTFIVLFGLIYQRIALKLTKMECPRTQPEFEASYTVKVYLFQFINNYSSIFYVAFFKGVYGGSPEKYHRLFGKFRQEECGVSCMPELCIQLAVIMIGKQAANIFKEALIPWMKRVWKKALKRCKVESATAAQVKESRGHSLEDTSRQWEKDYDLLQWGTFSLTEEYLDKVLQFGFVTIFVSAFPLAPLFALINNALELRIDGQKLLKHYRRPVGKRTKDIGVWGSIVEGIVKVAVLVNAFIIALTSNFIPKLLYRYFHLDSSSPRYGSLEGYLKNSLTAYDTADLETPVDAEVLKRTDNASVCYFPTYRNDYSRRDKYQFKLQHWQIWLARVVFVVLYENIIAMIMLFFRWLIPDVPGSLRIKMHQEERMINNLIAQQELIRSQRKSKSNKHQKRPRSQDIQEGSPPH